MLNYEHRQFSPWPLVALGAFALSARKKPSRLFFAIGLGLLATHVFALTTRVDERGVSWNFGLSLPICQIAFDAIAKVERTQTGVLEGFGIHWSPQRGWLWKVSGRDAVTIRKKDGGIVTLGSNDAAGLYESIKAGMLQVQ